MFPVRVKKVPLYRVLVAFASGMLLVLAVSAATGSGARAEPVQAPAATWFVTSTQDEGGTCPHASNCTLRAAIAAANDGDTIEFALLLPATIKLSKPLVIVDSITINGPTAGSVTIDGGGTHQLLLIPGTSLSLEIRISNLALAHGKAESGAAIMNDSATLTVVNSTLSDNSAGKFGGTIYNDGGTLTVKNSTLSDNSAGKFGGAIYNNGGTLTVKDSTLSDNSAGESGGAIRNFNGTLTVRNSTLSGNRADNMGGAIFSEGWGETAMAHVFDSTVTANVAGGGGGIVNSGSVGYCSGEFCKPPPGTAQFTITNTIIAGNTGDGVSNDCLNEADTSSDANLVSGGHNILIQGTCSLTRTLGAPPDAEPLNTKEDLFLTVLSQELTDNGGPTMTHALKLIAKNPAVDAIPAGECGVTKDQRGAPRPLGEGCDIGAYELVRPEIYVNKRVNYDAAECGPYGYHWVKSGGAVHYCSTIWNTGNVTLTDFRITDEALGIIDQSVDIAPLLPGSSVSITRQDIRALGPVTITGELINTIKVTGRNQELENLGIAARATGGDTAVVWPLSVFVEIEPGPGCNDLVCTRYITATVYSGTPDTGLGELQVPVGFEVTGGSPAPYQEDYTDDNYQAFFSYTSTLPTTAGVPSNGENVSRTLAAPDQLMDSVAVWVELVRNQVWDSGFEPGIIASLPTAVTWSSFSGHPNGDGSVILQWETALETDTAGFNVHRAPASDGPYARINDALIGAAGEGGGAGYTYTDTPPAGQVFFYKIEEVDARGASTFHGPIEVRVAPGQGPHRLHLPLVAWQ